MSVQCNITETERVAFRKETQAAISDLGAQCSLALCVVRERVEPPSSAWLQAMRLLNSSLNFFIEQCEKEVVAMNSDICQPCHAWLSEMADELIAERQKEHVFETIRRKLEESAQ